MISQTVEYALRAVVTIAQQHGRPCTARAIAATSKVPGPYLSKLMQGLVRNGVVRSQRGRRGGFVLVESPEKLTILDVIDAVEPIQRIHECPLGIASHGVNLCPLHRRLDKAISQMETVFRETTVAEVLSQPGSVSPLCQEAAVVPLEFVSLEETR